MEEIMNKTQYPDSLEMDFGGVRKAGKVYFNTGDATEAKQRITNMVDLAIHAENEINRFKKAAGGI